MRWIVALVMMTACKGPTGDAGPQGEQGLQGEPGPPGDPAAYWWVDAQGQRVAPYGSDVYVDGDGLVWQLVDYAGEARPLVLSAYFESEDCTGTTYVDMSQAKPRTVFRFLHDDALRACADGVQAGQVDELSTLDATGTCVSGSGNELGDATMCPVIDAAPPAAWTLPLHVEG
jgi:hypothetical protein